MPGHCTEQGVPLRGWLGRRDLHAEASVTRFLCCWRRRRVTDIEIAFRLVPPSCTRRGRLHDLDRLRQRGYLRRYGPVEVMPVPAWLVGHAVHRPWSALVDFFECRASVFSLEGSCSSSVDCQHNGTCAGAAPNKSCICQPGWTGVLCTVQRLFCALHLNDSFICYWELVSGAMQRGCRLCQWGSLYGDASHQELRVPAGLERHAVYGHRFVFLTDFGQEVLIVGALCRGELYIRHGLPTRRCLRWGAPIEGVPLRPWLEWYLVHDARSANSRHT